MCAHDPLLFEKISWCDSPTVALDRRASITLDPNRCTQAHRESGAVELIGRHYRHRLYSNFIRDALAIERQQSCPIDVVLGLLTVEIKFDQDVSAGKPGAASAKIF